MPRCYEGICAGHNADDLLPFGNFSLPQRARPKRPGGGFSNLEFYEFTAPHNPDLPYVYDNFAWEHCERAGYTFSPGYHPGEGNATDDAAGEARRGEFPNP